MSWWCYSDASTDPYTCNTHRLISHTMHGVYGPICRVIRGCDEFIHKQNRAIMCGGCKDTKRVREADVGKGEGAIPFSTHSSSFSELGSSSRQSRNQVSISSCGHPRSFIAWTTAGSQFACSQIGGQTLKASSAGLNGSMYLHRCFWAQGYQQPHVSRIQTSVCC